MEQRKWIDQSQPQTLQAATLLCYLNAALAVIYLLAFGPGVSLALLPLGAAAYGIANEWRWAYWGAAVLACLYLVAQTLFFIAGASLGGLINLLFAIVLVVLLVHPESREYQRIWFH